jgi:hypothetical protein
MKIVNRLLANDLYDILRADDLKIKPVETKAGWELVWCEDENSSLHYPYENEGDAKEDYQSVKKLYKKLR